MKFGLMFANAGPFAFPQLLTHLATTAERVGVESIWTVEHVVIPVGYKSTYPYDKSGKIPAPDQMPIPDPLIALAFAAAVTKTLKLATGILILPQRHPLYTAKEVATLDQYSNGRVILGIGIGWLREEFDAMGVPFAARGARFDDYVAAMRKVWSGDVVEHNSQHLRWHGFKSFPLPVQSPFPVIIGGIKGKVFDRIAQHGNGWYAPLGDPAQLTDELAKLRAASERIGRDFKSIEITASFGPGGGLDMVRRMRDAGAHRLTTFAAGFGKGNVADGIKRIGDEIVGKL